MLNAIFDFNGTMFFDEAFQEKAWQQYMTEKLGRRITPEEFQTWIHGRNTGDTLEYFFGRPFTQQEADEEEEAEETIYRALCRQSPDYKLADGLVPQHPAGTMSVSFLIRWGWTAGLIWTK